LKQLVLLGHQLKAGKLYVASVHLSTRFCRPQVPHPHVPGV